MKVLLINHFPLHGSGSGIYTQNIAKELIKKGHEVFVIDLDNRKDNREYKFGRRTVLFDVTKNQEPDLPFNFPCFTTHPRSKNTFYKLDYVKIEQYINKLKEVISQTSEAFQPDIIHAQHIWIIPYIAALLKIPYVITAHGTDLMGYKKDPRYHKYAEESVKKCQKIITISAQVKKDTLSTFNIPKNKVKLIPNGFDQTIFRKKDIDRQQFLKQYRLEKIEKKRVISFVGKFTEFKGIDVLLNAAEKVQERMDDVVFFLAGDGELRDNMEKLAIKLELENIFFLGHQPQELIADLYNVADLSIVPSRIEPFGLVAIEAMACGTPVIATNAGGLPDFIDDSVGHLVKMDNTTALADAILEELKSNKLNEKSEKAHKLAHEKFSWEKSINKVISVYKEAIE